jgi:hypothetical protein
MPDILRCSKCNKHGMAGKFASCRVNTDMAKAVFIDGSPGFVTLPIGALDPSPFSWCRTHAKAAILFPGTPFLGKPIMIETLTQSICQVLTSSGRANASGASNGQTGMARSKMASLFYSVTRRWPR